MKYVKRTLALLTPVVTALVLLLGIRTAQAEPSIAVAPIEGDDSGDMRDAVSEALDSDELDLISNSKVTKAIDQLGYDADLSEKQAKKVARELEVDALLVAKLGKRGKNKTLRVTIYVKGKKQKGFRVTFNNAKSGAFKSKFRDKVVERISSAKGGDDDDDDNDRRRRKRGDDDDDDRRRRKRGDDDDDRRRRDDDDEDDADSEIDEAVARVSGRGPGRVAVRADLGGSVKNRTLRWTQRPYDTFPQGPKNFKNGYVPGARFEGELYPLAFSDPKSPAAGLGIFGGYDRVVGNNLSTSLEPGVVVPTKFYAWWIGAKYRLSIGKEAVAPSVTIGAAYGKRGFSPDRDTLMDPRSLDIPTTRYKMFLPSLGFRVPFARPVALVADVRVPLVLDAGPVQQLDSYGRAKITAVEGLAGFDLTFSKNFGLRLAFEYARYGFEFEGNGFETNSRDADPDTQDIGGAVDQSLGGSATLSVMY